MKIGFLFTVLIGLACVIPADAQSYAQLGNAQKHITQACDAQCFSQKAFYSHGYSYAPTYVAPVTYQTYATSYVPYVYPSAFTVGYNSGVSDLEKEFYKLKIEFQQSEIERLKDKFAQHPPGPFKLPTMKEVEPLPLPKVDPPKQASQIPAQPSGNALALMVAKCAKCHDTDSAKTKGDGIILLSGGQLMPLSDGLRFKTLKALSNQTMPKGDKLTEAEAGTLIQSILGVQ